MTVDKIWIYDDMMKNQMIDLFLLTVRVMNPLF